MKCKVRKVAACATLLWIATAPAAAIAEPKCQRDHSQRPAAGMQIHLDPDTGAIRSEPAPATDAPDLARRAAKAQPVIIEPGTNGGITADVGERFASSFTVEVQPDGRLVERCGVLHGSGAK